VSVDRVSHSGYATTAEKVELLAKALDSEKAGAYLPLGIHSLSISSSPSAHVFAVLDTVREAEQKGVEQGLYGRDVMVWGGNG
jgi:hypothetical protein